MFRFKIDQNYIGEPPKLEITITNLNDNIDKTFLADMIKKCGVYDELNIYYHPVTNKHLGLARLVFKQTKSARMCVDTLNGKSVMGKVIENLNTSFPFDFQLHFVDFECFLRRLRRRVQKDPRRIDGGEETARTSSRPTPATRPATACSAR
jgi:RNA recognition motif-containing protein